MNENISPAPNAELTYLERSTGDVALGLFMFVALFLLLSSWIWLKSEPLWSSPQRFEVKFQEVAGMNTNAAVYTDGVRIGMVEKITLKAKHNVAVRIKISDEKLRLPEGTTFTILTSGIVGAKYVDATLPDPQKASKKLLTLDSHIVGTDPIRAELLITKLARRVSDVDFDRLQMRIDTGLEKVASASENISRLSRKLQPAAEGASIMETHISSMAIQMGGTSSRINRLLDDPQFTRDLKATTINAREISERLNRALKKADEMLGDEDLRQDVVATLENTRDTMASLNVIMADLEMVSKNPVIRADLKELLTDTRKTMASVRTMLTDPAFGCELKCTLTKTRGALSRLNTVSKQISQILSKRAPLLQMLLGRPGKLPPAQTAASTENQCD